MTEEFFFSYFEMILANEGNMDDRKSFTFTFVMFKRRKEIKENIVVQTVAITSTSK